LHARTCEVAATTDEDITSVTIGNPERHMYKASHRGSKQQ